MAEHSSTTGRVAIVSAVRTPIGAFGGCLKDIDAPTLAAVAIREALQRAAIRPDEVQEVVMGNVLQAGTGPNPARRAAVDAGIPYEVPSFTINKVCGSGLKALELAANAIRLGHAEIVVAGGMESMSSANYLLANHRWGNKMGHTRVVDSIIHDALWDCFYDCHMADTVEHLSQLYGVTREEQDRYSCESQRRYAKALAAGKFSDELTPVNVCQQKGDILCVDRDEFPRPGTTIDALAKLRPAFRQDGAITAGNASGVNDGAAAVVLASERTCAQRNLPSLAWIGATASVGVDPMLMGIGPAHAIRQVLKRSQCDKEAVDLYEVNEAFAAQVLAVGRELKLDDHKLNVNGGAIAVGHPLGASGARIVVTLLHEMQRRESRQGIAALCVGGGMGIAMMLERT